MRRGVELLAVSAERLVGTPAEHTFENDLAASAVVVAFYGALSTHLVLVALE